MIKTTKDHLKNAIVAIVLLAVPALLGAVLTNISFAHDPILTAAKVWEDSQRVSVGFAQFIFAIGPIALLIPFGIRQVFREKSPLALLFIVLGLLSFGMFFSPLPALLHTSQVRWISPVTYTIFPLLAIFGLKEVVQILSRYTHLKASLLRDGIVLLYLLLTVPSLLSQIDARTKPLLTDQTELQLNHLSPSIMHILSTLETRPTTDVVLTDPSLPIDVLIPVTGKRTFTGHPIHTLYPTVKDQLRRTFFEGAMNDRDAQKFFTDHRIRFIIMTDMALRTLPQYSQLHELDHQEGLTLYER